MSLKIRLSRAGAKKRPFYHLVIADARSPRDGRYLERVGSYNPMVAKDHDQRVVVKQDRVQYWLGVGAQPTDKVARILSVLGLVEKPAIPAQTKKDKPRARTLERIKAQAEAVATASAAAEAAAAAPVEEAAPEAAPEEAAPEAPEAPAEEASAPEEAAPEEASPEAAAEEAPAEKAAAEEVPDAPADKDGAAG
jgi:small subunit ribosomal protein S16